MSTMLAIGQRVAAIAAVIVGGALASGTLAAIDAQPAAPAAPVTSPIVAAPAVPADTADRALKVTPDPAVAYVFECRGKWKACVPDESPNGAPVDRIEEDGSASYTDGWVIAPAAAPVPIVGTVVGEWTAPQNDTAPVRTVAHAAPQPQPRPAAGACSEAKPSTPSKPSTTATPQPTTAPQPTTPAGGGKVNVNTATLAELDALPGIGDVLAQRIVEQRPYASVNDLHRVSRIPAKVFPLVTV